MREREIERQRKREREKRERGGEGKRKQLILQRPLPTTTLRAIGVVVRKFDAYSSKSEKTINGVVGVDIKLLHRLVNKGKDIDKETLVERDHMVKIGTHH